MVQDFVNKARLESLRKKAELFKGVSATGDLADTHRREEFMHDLLDASLAVMKQETVNIKHMNEIEEIKQISQPGKIASFLQHKQKKAMGM